jgi:hypothetical protein
MTDSRGSDMTDPQRTTDPDAQVLTRADARFIARVGDAYRARPPSAEQRVAFQAGLDARIARRRWVFRLRALAGAVAAAAAAWLVVAGLGSGDRSGELRIARAGDPRAVSGSAGATAEEAILSLSAEDESEDESLPDDYAAIADLFLDS